LRRHENLTEQGIPAVSRALQRAHADCAHVSAKTLRV